MRIFCHAARAPCYNRESRSRNSYATRASNQAWSSIEHLSWSVQCVVLLYRTASMMWYFLHFGATWCTSVCASRTSYTRACKGPSVCCCVAVRLRRRGRCDLSLWYRRLREEHTDAAKHSERISSVSALNTHSYTAAAHAPLRRDRIQ